MKKQLINEAFRLQTLAGIKPINSLNEDTAGFHEFMDVVDSMYKPGTPEHAKLSKAVEDALDNSRLAVNQYGVDDAEGQVKTIAKKIGLLKEGENNYVMVTYEGHNIEHKVLGKVGQLDIEKYVDNYVNQKKAEYLQDDDSDSEYAEQFFYYGKDDIYGKGEIYQGQVGEDTVFDVFEIPSDVTDIDAWVDSQTR
jgi:hypothetical protein